MSLLPQEPMSAWWDYLRSCLDGPKREEALLQLQLAGGDDHPHTVKRIEEFGPGARAFLAQVQWMTQVAWLHPTLHWWISLSLRQFMHNFLRLERALARRAALPHAEWRELHEEKLVGIVSANGGHFSEVFTYSALPPEAQEQVVQGFAEAVGIPDAAESVPVQMS